METHYLAILFLKKSSLSCPCKMVILKRNRNPNVIVLKDLLKSSGCLYSGRFSKGKTVRCTCNMKRLVNV